MKLLLCSDFSSIGYKFLNKIDRNLVGKSCLFVGYAQDDIDEQNSSSSLKLKKLGLNVIYLDKNYDFCDNLDYIFVRGGNTARLLYFLKKYNQFEKIKQLVKSGSFYIGNSAGSLLVGDNLEWTIKYEPFEIDLEKEFGKNGYTGFGFIKKMMFVHCSRFTIARDENLIESKDYRILDTFCYPDYLKELKNYKGKDYIRIGNNQALYVDGDKQKMLTYNWSKIPVKK